MWGCRAAAFLTDLGKSVPIKDAPGQPQRDTWRVQAPRRGRSRSRAAFTEIQGRGRRHLLAPNAPAVLELKGSAGSDTHECVSAVPAWVT